MEKKKRVARIFEDVGGYFIGDDDTDDCLDARGHAHTTKISALRSAAYEGYTHAVGSGTYWGNQIRSIAAYAE